MNPTRARASSLAVVMSLILGATVVLSSASADSESDSVNPQAYLTPPSATSFSGYFTENRGQVSWPVRFYAMGNPAAGFRDDGVMYVINEGRAGSVGEVRFSAVLMKFDGANRVLPSGIDELSFKSNFLQGNIPSEWRTGVPSYREVLYSNLYDGIDLLFRTVPEGLKYEFVVRPGADPALIRISYEGANRIELDGTAIVARSEFGSIRESIPLSYQEGGKSVTCAYEMHSPLSFGFDCEGRDISKTLVIDPLAYSTYLGGSSGEYGNAIRVDTEGNAYVAGYTWSANFPTTPGSYSQTSNAKGSVFVSKLILNGSALAYSTFIGGSEFDSATSMDLDSSNNVYITGYTESPNFPTTVGAYNRTYLGTTNAGAIFVTKLNPSGSSLVYSTFLGTGVGLSIGTVERPYAIAVDQFGSAYVTGHVNIGTYPTTAGAYDRTYNGGSFDSVVTKLNATGSTLNYSTFLGGISSDHTTAIAVDSDGNAYVTGLTASTDYPTTAGAYQTVYGGEQYDAFVTKVNSAGSGLAYSTFLGSPDIEEGYGIDVDSAGFTYITGLARPFKFPTTAGAYSTTYNGGTSDAFVTKMNPSGNSLTYSTFLGGAALDVGFSIVVDSSGSAIVTGVTSDNTFPTTAGAYDRSYNGGLLDIFLAKVNLLGSGLSYSTFIGGSNQDDAFSVALRSTRDVYISGDSMSSDYPTTFGAFDRTLNGAPNAIVTRLVFANNPPIASVGPDYGTYRNFSSTLDGSTSSDPDGDPIYYLWSQVSGSPTLIANMTQAVASIRPLSLGVLEFMLNVTDEYGASSTDNIVVTVSNLPPIANAGPDAFGYRNTMSSLDGRGSSDPNGDSLTYFWNQTSGPAYPALAGQGTATPWFTPPVLGVYVFVLNVSDPYGAWKTDVVNITVINRKPVVEAGPEQFGAVNQIIYLDGSATYDPDGDPLTYIWSKMSGPAVVINNSSEAIAWVQPQTVGVYQFMLEARDGLAGWAIDRCNVTIGNAPPIAEAGPDRDVPRNVLVELNGSMSHDLDGTIVAYRWTQTAGPAVTLNNANTVTASFIPTVIGSFTFLLNVTDDGGATDTDSVVISVVNRPPIADAGIDLTEFKNEVITLDGTGSYDPDGDSITYAWIQLSGPIVMLGSPDTARPTYTAVSSGIYVFNLTVRDSFAASAWDQANVIVVNRDPVANAGEDGFVPLDLLVMMDGSASYDPDNDPLLYSWTQTGGPAVILNDADTANPTFTPVVAGTYSFELTVDDGDGGTATDMVILTALPGDPPVADAKVWPGTVGDLGTVFVFDGANSTDPEGPIVNYRWSLGDGNIKSGENITHTYSARGFFTVRLTVTDSDGMTNFTTLEIEVMNRPPQIVARTPGASSVSVTQGRDQTFAVHATDPDGDPVSYVWRLDSVVVEPDSPWYLFNITATGTYVVNITVSDGLLEDWFEWTITVTEESMTPTDSVDTSFPWWLVGVAIVEAFIIFLLLFPMKRKKKAQKEEETIPMEDGGGEDRNEEEPQEPAMEQKVEEPQMIESESQESKPPDDKLE